MANMQTLENVKEHVDWVNEHNIRLHCKYMYPNNCTYSFKIFWEWYFYYFRKFESKQRTVKKTLSISSKRCTSPDLILSESIAREGFDSPFLATFNMCFREE